MDKKVEVISRERVYQGFFALDKITLKHRRFDGSMSRAMTREIFERGHAVAVLIHDPSAQTLLMVEQFRPGAMHTEDPWLLEVVAGMRESGESEEALARRESLEEAGVAIENLRKVGHYAVSPGGCTETIALYYATADLSQAGGIHGLLEEDEDIRVCIQKVDDLQQMLDSGKVSNGISVIALQWFLLQSLQGLLINNAN